jgi:hypothetical protein
LEQQWVISKYAQKREILNLVCLNFRLGVSLVAEMNKPFDMLAEGLLIPSSRGDWTPIELFVVNAVASLELLAPSIVATIDGLAAIHRRNYFCE